MQKVVIGKFFEAEPGRSDQFTDSLALKLRIDLQPIQSLPAAGTPNGETPTCPLLSKIRLARIEEGLGKATAPERELIRGPIVNPRPHPNTVSSRCGTNAVRQASQLNL